VNRLTRILPIAAGLLWATLVFGCTSELTAPGGPAFAESRPGEGINTFTSCKPQPYAAASGWIGPNGGLLKAGKHTLKVPANALSAPTWITMEVPSNSINRVVFGPDGLTFKQPALLAMSYTDCSVKGEQQIVYVNDQLRILEVMPSQSDPLRQMVYGTLTHFSDYALSTYAVVY
jgi:hypothetical protein